jgi:hypothetical protein
MIILQCLPHIPTPSCTCMYWLAAPDTELPSLHLRYPTRLDPLRARPMITNTTHFSFRENRAVKNSKAWEMHHL